MSELERVKQEELEDILDLDTTNMGVLEIKAEYKRRILNKIWAIANSGEKGDDEVRLKALQVILAKIMPDKTKMEVDVKSQAPYAALVKALEDKGNAA